MDKIGKKLKAAKSATASASKEALTTARQTDPHTYKIFFRDYNTLSEERDAEDDVGEETVWQSRVPGQSDVGSVHSDSEDELSLGDDNDYKFGVMRSGKKTEVEDIEFHDTPPKPPRTVNGAVSWRKGIHFLYIF